MDDNTIIARYIEAAASSSKGEAGLDQARLEEAARGAGLSDSDLAVIKQRRLDLAAMGAGFAAKALWSDAIAAWQEASDLAPWDIQPLLRLGEAWLGLHAAGKSGKPDAKALDKAEAAARRVIGLHPGDEAAYQLLARIQQARQKPATTTADSKTRLLALGFSAAILAGIFVLGLLNYRNKPAAVSVSESVAVPAAPLPGQPVVDKPAEPLVSTPQVPVNTPASDQDRAQDIPVSAPAGQYGLQWSAIRSTLERYDLKDPSWAYNLAMAATSQTTAFRELDIAVHFLDRAGNRLFTRRESVIQDYQPVHYSGDNIKLRLLVYEKGLPPDIHSVLVETGRAVPLSGNSRVPLETATAVEWADESGNALANGLVLQLRRVELSGGFGQRYLYVDLGYSNTGQRSFNRLKFRCEWYDQDGKLVDQDTTWGFIQGDPLFEPERRGVCGFILSGPADSTKPARLRVVVEEASLM